MSETQIKLTGWPAVGVALLALASLGSEQVRYLIMEYSELPGWRVKRETYGWTCWLEPC